MSERSKFVRALPPDMPTLEVQARAKKQGLKISRNHIYTIRGTMKKEREATAAQTEHKASTSAPSHSSGVVRLQAAILDVGLEKSLEVFANVRANLAHLFEQPASKVRSAVHAS